MISNLGKTAYQEARSGASLEITSIKIESKTSNNGEKKSNLIINNLDNG